MGSYNPTGGTTGLVELIQTGIDANASTNSNSIDIGDAQLVIFQVRGATGTHGTHILQCQCSVDNSNWNDISGATVTGEGVKGEISVASQYVRVRVSTVESATSTINLIIQAK